MMNAQLLIEVCKQKNKTIASCESLTAGLFTSTIASTPGASSVLKGGIVTYFTEIKEKLVHVDPSIVLEYGVVSQQCAVAMAKNTRELMDVDYCVSFTGNAGPDVMENKPAGCVWCALATKNDVQSFHFQLDGMNRNQVRQKVVEEMIDQLIQSILEEEGNNGR
jgi:PncC family amidohydrolase